MFIGERETDENLEFAKKLFERQDRVKELLAKYPKINIDGVNVLVIDRSQISEEDLDLINKHYDKGAIRKSFSAREFG